MEIMVDSANLDKVRHCLDYYPISGVTTNPSILKLEGRIDVDARVGRLRELCQERSLHVQLVSDDCDGMLDEAERVRTLAGKNTYVKVPVTEEGVRAIRRLKARGVNVTATAIYTQMQGVLAIAAGADYLAPYCNRMENNDVDFRRVIASLRQLIDRDGYASRILAASFKNVAQITNALDAGAHAVTLPPDMLATALGSALVADAVRAFRNDHEQQMGER